MYNIEVSLSQRVLNLMTYDDDDDVMALPTSSQMYLQCLGV